MTVGPNLPQKGQRRIKCLLIDLDDTLYRNHDVPRIVREKIQEYMRQKLDIAAEDVERVTQELYFQYGTTMAGLVAKGHHIDYDDWHRCVHHEALDYNTMIKPDILLREMLCSIDLPKYILTNADHHHAKVCLDRLGISDCFKGIYDFEWIMAAGKSHGLLTPEHPVLCKPSPNVYKLVLEAVGCEASEVMFFDDSVRNVSSAHSVGIYTVLIGTDKPTTGADLSLLDMHQLPAAMPELFDQPGLVHDSHGHSQAGSQSQVPLPHGLTALDTTPELLCTAKEVEPVASS